jgi:hypothetical protein
MRVAGVPRWMTVLGHYWAQWRICTKKGHEPIFANELGTLVCNQCGKVFGDDYE